jgi:hypothetical protein
MFDAGTLKTFLYSNGHSVSLENKGYHCRPLARGSDVPATQRAKIEANQVGVSVGENTILVTGRER